MSKSWLFFGQGSSSQFCIGRQSQFCLSRSSVLSHTFQQSVWHRAEIVFVLIHVHRLQMGLQRTVLGCGPFAGFIEFLKLETKIPFVATTHYTMVCFLVAWPGVVSRTHKDVFLGETLAGRKWPHWTISQGSVRKPRRRVGVWLLVQCYWSKAELLWKLDAKYFSLDRFTVVEPNHKIQRQREKTGSQNWCPSLVGINTKQAWIFYMVKAPTKSQLVWFFPVFVCLDFSGNFPQYK